MNIFIIANLKCEFEKFDKRFVWYAFVNKIKTSTYTIPTLLIILILIIHIIQDGR